MARGWRNRRRIHQQVCPPHDDAAMILRALACLWIFAVMTSLAVMIAWLYVALAANAFN